MKLKNTPLVASLILALSLPNFTSAAVVVVDDLSSGGTYTIGAGDSATNGTFIASVFNVATAGTMTVNGSWVVDGEIQLGGLESIDANQNATLNIGTVGVVSVKAFWVAGGWGTPLGSATINIAQGGQLTIAPGNFGIRAVEGLGGNGSNFNFTGDGSTTNGGNDALGVYTLLWNAGVLKKDGTQTGTFAQNFSFVQNGGAGAGTLTAIPEPSTALLGGLGMLCLLRRRRA